MKFEKGNEYWKLGKGNYKHGLRHKRIYNIWRNMWHRCTKPTDTNYRNYGERGISVCEEWKDPKVFADWAYKNGYSDSLTIDRIDVNGNYEPRNCRWVTYTAQANNKTNNVLIEYNGEKHTFSEWGKITGIPLKTIWGRIRVRGWSAEKALTTPVGTIDTRFKKRGTNDTA